MKPDRRKNWEDKGIEIRLVDCQHPTWGKCGEGLRFDKTGWPTNNETGTFYLRYWQFRMPDGFPGGSWMTVAYKKTARDFIDAHPKWTKG